MYSQRSQPGRLAVRSVVVCPRQLTDRGFFFGPDLGCRRAGHTLLTSCSRPEDQTAPSVYSDCLQVDVLAAAGPGPALELSFARIKNWGHEFACHGPTDYIGSIHYFVGCGLEGGTGFLRLRARARSRRL
jgi:hypothetical protein